MNQDNEINMDDTEEHKVETPDTKTIEDVEGTVVLETAKEPKEKKHQKALRLVAQAKQIVKDAEEQTQACKLLLADDLKEYDDAKRSLRSGGMDACLSLLEQLGYQPNEAKQMVEEKVVVFEPKEEISPIVLKNVSSGRFTGFVYALASGVATTVGLTYLATEKLGMTLDITKVPTPETMQTITTWFSTSVGFEPNVYVGAGILGLASVSVMALVYGLRVALRGSKNLHFAVKQFVEAEIYTEYKADCKAEMDKVDAHMKETVSTLKLYEVLFNEQKGKLERIIHIEGSKSKSTDYHEKSYAEIRETKNLVRAIETFISLPMSKEGRLSDDSVEALSKAKAQVDKMLERLY